MRRPLMTAILVTAMFVMPVSVEALDTPSAPPRPNKQKYLVWNIALTPVFTLISSRIQRHRALTPGEITESLVVGLSSGALFYEAKRIAGAGRTTEGWLLANATSSLVENTASGEHVFGRFGYTVGPLRFRFATPFARQAAANIEADWSLAETAALVRGRLLGDHFRFRHGLIAIDRDTPWPTKDLANGFDGLTNGSFPEWLLISPTFSGHTR